jgi:hypothetical protein
VEPSDEADGGVAIEAKGPEGTVRIDADWLIAADGVRSTVRELLGIAFDGGPVPGRYLVTEGRVDGDFESGVVHYFLRSAGSMVFAPLRGGSVRMGAPITEDTPLTEQTVQRLLDERGPGGLRVASLAAITTFSSQERVAGVLRRDRCFLVGDAAHTHSPIGGQGLNLGLQDVHNLAWKLGGVIAGRLAPAVLDSYEPERRQAAGQVVGNTRRAARMFLLGPAGARVRNACWLALERTGALRRWFTPLLAGWRLRYDPDLLCRVEDRDRRSPFRDRLLPAAGARMPHRLPSGEGRGTAVAAFRLLTLGPGQSALRRGAEELAGRHSPLCVHEHVSLRARPGFVLVRPDGFVAASGRGPAALARADELLRALRPAAASALETEA